MVGERRAAAVAAVAVAAGTWVALWIVRRRQRCRLFVWNCCVRGVRLKQKHLRHVVRRKRPRPRRTACNGCVRPSRKGRQL